MQYFVLLQDGEAPEDVDWSFVLHVNGSDGTVHKVNYQTMVNSRHRFDHNRTGKYSGARRGSEANGGGGNYDDELDSNTEPATMSNAKISNTTQSTQDGKGLKEIENDILNMDPKKIHDSLNYRSRLTKQEKQLLDGPQ